MEHVSDLRYLLFWNVKSGLYGRRWSSPERIIRQCEWYFDALIPFGLSGLHSATSACSVRAYVLDINGRCDDFNIV